jgi:hypothetical protein
MATVISQIVEVVITHPEDTLTAYDVIKELPNLKKPTVWASMSNLVRSGYLDRTIDKPNTRGGPKVTQIYKILKRDPHKPGKPGRKGGYRKNGWDEPPEKAKPEEDLLSYSQVGKRIVIYIQEIEKALNESRADLNELSSTYHKEVSSSKVVRERHIKKIKELEEMVKNLHEKIRQDAKERGVFSFGDSARVKTNQHKTM